MDYYLVDVASKFSSRLETMVWWEDFKVGDISDMGSYRFTEAEIVAFARQFDPQPFHTDPEAAARTPSVASSRAAGTPARSACA